MATSARAVVAFLLFLNVLAVCMGYIGIAKLERYQAPPFHREGLYHIAYLAKHVPNTVVLVWHSRPGSVLVWAGTIILPLLAAVVIFRRERPLIGTVFLFLSFLPFGVTGFFIWLHAYIDLPHDW